MFFGVVLFVRPNQTKSSDFSLIFYLVYLQMEEENKALLKFGHSRVSNVVSE